MTDSKMEGPIKIFSLSFLLLPKGFHGQGFLNIEMARPLPGD